MASDPTDLRFIGSEVCGRWMYKAQQRHSRGPFFWWKTIYLTGRPDWSRIEEPWWKWL